MSMPFKPELGSYAAAVNIAIKVLKTDTELTICNGRFVVISTGSWLTPIEARVRLDRLLTVTQEHHLNLVSEYVAVTSATVHSAE